MFGLSWTGSRKLEEAISENRDYTRSEERCLFGMNGDGDWNNDNDDYRYDELVNGFSY